MWAHTSLPRKKPYITFMPRSSQSSQIHSTWTLFDPLDLTLNIWDLKKNPYSQNGIHFAIPLRMFPSCYKFSLFSFWVKSIIFTFHFISNMYLVWLFVKLSICCQPRKKNPCHSHELVTSSSWDHNQWWVVTKNKNQLGDY